MAIVAENLIRILTFSYGTGGEKLVSLPGDQHFELQPADKEVSFHNNVVAGSPLTDPQ